MRGTDQTLSDVSRAPIRPELVAAKLAAVRNYECPGFQRAIAERPRLVELLWFIQAMSLRPGGLAKFTEELLAAFPERLGTPTMRAAFGREYTLEEKIAVYDEFPSGGRPNIGQDRDEVLVDLLPNWKLGGIVELVEAAGARLDAALKKAGASLFRDQCQAIALQRLPAWLFALCTEKTKGRSEEDAALTEAFDDPSARFDPDGHGRYGWQTRYAGEVWFFGDAIGAMIELMDRRAGEVQKRLAMTEVAEQVFDALDYALSAKVMVRIVGASRFGKTESLQTWCDMRPGLARLVRVPCDNSMHSFFKRIGEALGVDCSYGSSSSRLKERIEYVIEHSGLFLVLDEGAFLIPQNYTETTAPHRLNWVRTEIVDRNLPVAIAVTPQSFDSAVRRFVKKTQYTMEQFFGRSFLTRVLPASLPEADMIAVARIHFPEMDDDILGYIANEARLSQNYLQAVEAIAELARWKAAKGKRRLGVKDLRAAAAEVLPREPAAVAPVPAPDKNAVARGRSVGRGLVAVNEPLTAGSRAVKPAAAGGGEGDFPSCSLRGSGLERVSAGCVSAEP